MEILVETCEAAAAESCAVNCPQLQEACNSIMLDSNPSNSTSLSKAEAYGYGFLMILVISLLSLLGLIVVPLLKGNNRLLYVYKNVIYLLISMGVAALIADALVHLIPHALRTGSHNGEEQEDMDKKAVIAKMCVVVVGALSFFLLELLLKSIATSFGHTHSHGALDTLSSGSESNDEKQTVNSSGVEHGKRPQKGYGTLQENDNTTATKFSCRGFLNSLTSVKPLAWVIVTGDGMHNLTDGLAVGVAISQSLGLGLSTAIAILFHEIPHELSDYAILLHTGLPWYKALLLNFASALTCLVGFFIGVAIGTESEESNQWVLVIIAGQFLYIALVCLLPEVLHSKEKGVNRVVQLVMTFIGMAIGFTILLMIALYEDKIDSWIK